MPIPKMKMNLKYKPMEHVTKVDNFFKFVPSVFSDSLTFDYHDRDYEIRERDRKFIHDLNQRIV